MQIDLLRQIRKDLAGRIESDHHEVESYVVAVSGVHCWRAQIDSKQEGSHVTLLQLWFYGGCSITYRRVGHGFLAGCRPMSADRQSAVLDWCNERLLNVRIAPLLGVTERAGREITTSGPDLQIRAANFDMYLAPPGDFSGFCVVSQHVIP